MIRAFLSLAFALCLATTLPAPAARAAATITFTQNGSDVVATGSGAFNLTALTLGSTIGVSARINPSIGNGFLGPTTTGNMSVYTGITGPATFGTGGATLVSSGSGNLFGIAEGATTPGLGVPQGYTSGSSLAATDTWTGKTITGLGLRIPAPIFGLGAAGQLPIP